MNGGGGAGYDISASVANDQTTAQSSPFSVTGGGGMGGYRGAGAVFNVEGAGLDGAQLLLGVAVAVGVGFVTYKLLK